MIKKIINSKTLNDLNEMISIRKKAAVVDLLGEGVRISGTYSSAKNVRVIGSIDGDLHVDGDVRVDEKGIVNGNVHARDIEVSGTVRGDLISEGKVVVRGTAVISGCLFTRSLEIEAKAVVEGGIYMSEQPGRKRDEKSPSKGLKQPRMRRSRQAS